MEELDKIQFREMMKSRLRKYVLELIKLAQQLPNNQETNIIKGQFIRSGSSTYANYRAACRARSKADFFSKMSIVVEEADETEMWLDLLINSKINESDELINLHKESIEILKVMSKARKNIYN